jgi:hypothetical protein
MLPKSRHSEAVIGNYHDGETVLLLLLVGRYNTAIDEEHNNEEVQYCYCSLEGTILLMKSTTTRRYNTTTNENDSYHEQ